MERNLHLVMPALETRAYFNQKGEHIVAKVEDSDLRAASIIESIRDFVKDDNMGFAFGQLCDSLQPVLPVLDEGGYAMSLEYAFFVEKTCRLMDDIYVFVQDGEDERLVNYVSGKRL